MLVGVTPGREGLGECRRRLSAEAVKELCQHHGQSLSFCLVLMCLLLFSCRVKIRSSSSKAAVWRSCPSELLCAMTQRARLWPWTGRWQWHGASWKMGVLGWCQMPSLTWACLCHLSTWMTRKLPCFRPSCWCLQVSARRFSVDVKRAGASRVRANSSHLMGCLSPFSYSLSRLSFSGRLERSVDRELNAGYLESYALLLWLAWNQLQSPHWTLSQCSLKRFMETVLAVVFQKCVFSPVLKYRKLFLAILFISKPTFVPLVLVILFCHYLLNLPRPLSGLTILWGHRNV